MRRSLSTIGLILVCGCDPFHTEFDDVEPAVMYESDSQTPAPSDPSDALMMTWNVKFGGGRLLFFWECNGTRGNMTRAEVFGNLEAIAEKINQSQPDVLLLSEVEVESKRAAYIDQVQWLLDHTHFNYGAYASQWKADYVPSDGLGRVNSGNAILSRWPLSDATRIALPLIDDQDGVTQYFFLRRNILRAAVPALDNLVVMATHLSAFSDDGTKLEQLVQLKDEMDGVSGTVVAGGDLNAIPPGSPRTSDFPDDCDDARFTGDDYSEETTWLDDLYAAYTPAIALADYQADPTSHFTFTNDPSLFWTRKLDYLFTNGVIRNGSGLVHQDASLGGLSTLERSDHAPVSFILELP